MTADPSALPLDTELADVESLDFERGGREVYSWVRLPDGRGALWRWVLAAPPGRAQTLRFIEGA